MAMLVGGGKGKAPISAAFAQLSFDCWVQEQEEGHQPDDIAECRNAFYGSVVAAEVAMRPPPPEPEPEPEPEPSYVTYYVVFFEFDSSDLSGAAMQTLDEAAATATEMRPYKILIRGHTDRGRSGRVQPQAFRAACALGGELPHRERGWPLRDPR